MKYLILDFGNVLAYPTTGYWFITPKFKEVVDMDKISLTELLSAIKEYNYILSKKAINEDEEYQIFMEFYTKIFKRINYPISLTSIKEIVSNFVYQDDKYTFYDDIYEELERLSKKYTLLMLTDNWPCILRILKERDLTKYFKKIYVSSIYGYDKKDKVLFDYPIKDFKIKKALFVDDNLTLLDIAKDKGLDVILMNRENKHIDTKYPIITSLKEIL